MLLLIAFVLSIAGCGEEKSLRPEIIKPEDKPWGSVEIDISDVLNRYDYVSLKSECDRSAEEKSVIFTTGREMENQRNVGYATETENIIVYRQFADRAGCEIINVDLFEGIVTDVYETGDIYYAVFYPYAGRGEIICRDSIYLENQVLYTYECEPVVMGDAPLEMFMLGGGLFAVHSTESDGRYEKKLLYIRGVGCNEIAAITDDKPFDISMISVFDELSVDEWRQNPENYHRPNLQYWKINTDESERTFTLYNNDEQTYQYALPYEAGDVYFTRGEDVYITRTKQAKIYEYKALEFLNKDDNTLYELETGSFYSFCSSDGIVIFSHGDYSDQEIKVVRHSYMPQQNHNRIYVDPVGLDTENCLVYAAIGEQDMVIMLKDGENNYKLYDLY